MLLAIKAHKISNMQKNSEQAMAAINKAVSALIVSRIKRSGQKYG